MNNLYVFDIDAKRFYVAAPNWKAARNILVKDPENKNVPLTDIVGHRVATGAAFDAGIISMTQAYESSAWWRCKCGSQTFVPIDDGRVCRCKECGREMRVPV